MRAPFLGMPDDCRMVLDGGDDELLGRIVVQAAQREFGAAQRAGRPVGPAAYLAISGGSENGAYGAGLLTGWSKRGTRPVFKAVTGVSTGALSAPFAFLGAQYDDELEYVYTEITRADVMSGRGVLAAVFSDSAYDSAQLLRLIRRFVVADLLKEVAHAYEVEGRLLFVATTNLDVPVGVLWNMGSIAASGHPRATDLFGRILLASASIPGLFPPVMIDIEAGNERYQEMHVDGGTTAQVVLYPPTLGGSEIFRHFGASDANRARSLAKRGRRLYVIRNSRPGPEPETVNRSTFRIAGRAISTLIQNQGIGDLYQLYLLTQRDGIDFNVSYIPSSFTDKIDAPFDRTYMRKLYALGHELALNGDPWHKLPPGYNPQPFTFYHPQEER